ncbi:MAG: CDP-alcohol phosphatidyltransferase family protein [Oscillospiraceae bacterium]
MANIVTGSRILFSIFLMFTHVFSPLFYFLYLMAGFTDMIDGSIARKTNTACEFGSKLDTAADAVFVAACMIKLLPVLEIPAWLYIWIGIIAVIKVLNMIIGYILQKEFTAKHSILNKIAGALLFILPLTISFVEIKYSAVFVCTVAVLAAIQESCLIICENKQANSRK